MNCPVTGFVQVLRKDMCDDVIVCFGDSLTEGDGDSNPGAFDKSLSYPAFLQTMLYAVVVNAGRCGDTAQAARARFERDVLSKKPRAVIVEFGANDFFCGRPVSDVKADLLAVICGIRRAGAQIFLVSFTGNAETQAAFKANMDYGGGSGFGERLCEYRKMFDELFRENPDAAPVINFWDDVYTDPSCMSRDRIHPLTKGYSKIARNVFNSIAGYLPASCLLPCGAAPT
ncbi:MAG: arylesterase [Treponemataceae bacterium]|nr:MAG: arylesterase [Treponemataceae bacterium]